MFQGIASSIARRRDRKLEARALSAGGCIGHDPVLGPRSAFFDVVDEVALREHVAPHVAMVTVRELCPELFKAAFPREAH